MQIKQTLWKSWVLSRWKHHYGENSDAFLRQSL